MGSGCNRLVTTHFWTYTDGESRASVSYLPSVVGSPTMYPDTPTHYVAYITCGKPIGRADRRTSAGAILPSRRSLSVAGLLRGACPKTPIMAPIGGKSNKKMRLSAFSCVKRLAGSVKRSGQGPRRTDHGAQVRIYVVSRIRTDARTAGGRLEAGGRTNHGARATGYASTLSRTTGDEGRATRQSFGKLRWA